MESVADVPDGLKQVGDELHEDESVEAGAEVVDDDAGAFWECFETANWRRLQDVEEAEEEKREQSVRPVGRECDECDELAADFIDDNEAWIFALRLACHACGCGNAEGDGERERDQRRDEEMQCVVVEKRCRGQPQQHRSNGGVSAGAGLEEAGAEKGGDGPGPERFFLCLLHESDCSDQRRGLVLVVACAATFGVKLRLFDLLEKFGVEDRRGDSVISRRPLAEIDQAAAVGAEGSVVTGGIDGLFADGAMQRLGGHVGYSMILATTS